VIMRDLIIGAMTGAREMLRDVAQDLRQEQLTDEELLTRYERDHANNPWAVLEFTRASLGAESATDPEVVRHALEYESEMERLRAQKGR